MNPLVSKENQKNIVEMLKEATAYGSPIGHNGLREMLSAPLHLSTFSNHDTGCQVRITLQAPNQPTITAWEGSVWNSSRYEFNDANKVLGLNPKCDFMEAALVRFFEAVQRRLDEHKAEIEAQKAAQKQREQDAEQSALDYYRRMASLTVN